MPHVAALVHLYPPTHNAGAEWMLHSILTDLIDRGWTAQVITNRPPRRRDSIDGVDVVHASDMRKQTSLLRRADVVLTHLDATRALLNLVPRRVDKPIVHLIHNDAQLEFHKVTPGRGAELVAFNSAWIARLNAWPDAQMILHPPVWLDRYTTEPPGPGDGSVTLMNLAERKGSPLFYELARRISDAHFLAVRGAYAPQHLPPGLPSNVEVMATQRNVRRVYERTRLLLMPSHYESWGRCAVEAAASGIPTIAADTPGLRETGVPAALLPHDDVDAWETEVRRLLDQPDAWAAASIDALAAAEHLEHVSHAQMARFDAALRTLAQLGAAGLDDLPTFHPPLALEPLPDLAAVERAHRDAVLADVTVTPLDHTGAPFAAQPIVTELEHATLQLIRSAFDDGLAGHDRPANARPGSLAGDAYDAGSRIHSLMPPADTADTAEPEPEVDPVFASPESPFAGFTPTATFDEAAAGAAAQAAERKSDRP